MSWKTKLRFNLVPGEDRKMLTAGHSGEGPGPTVHYVIHHVYPGSSCRTFFHVFVHNRVYFFEVLSGTLRNDVSL